MKIRYLREVYSPSVMAGQPFAERELADNMAQQLIREGYAELVVEPPAFVVEVTDEPLPETPGGLPPIGAPFPAEAATDEGAPSAEDDPTDIADAEQDAA